MTPNPFKQALKEGRPQIGLWAAVGDAYATELRSMSAGRGTFSAQVDHYEEVPSHVAQKIIDAHQKELAAAGGH